MSQITIQPALADVYIDASNPKKNFRKRKELWIGYFCGDMEYRILIKFNLCSLPENIGIVSAKLKLFISYSPDSFIPASVTPYIITEAWNPGTVTWKNAPSFDANIAGTTTSIMKAGWYEWKVTQIVNAWRNNTYPNEGIILKCNKRKYFDNKKAISSRDDDTCHIPLSPMLIVEYEDGSKGIPAVLSGRSFTEEYETVKTTDSFDCTPGYNTSQKSELTFFVKNLGAYPATAALQISPNNVDYMMDGKEIEIPAGTMKWLVPYIYAKYTRLCFKSAVEGKATVLYISYQAQV